MVFRILKTTIDIPEGLLVEAKALAARERTTLRAVVATGLRSVLGRRPPEHFRLRDASVGGGGLQPEFRTGGWERLRDAIYESRP
ncbi:hypothetical protein [Gaiella sp.]|jgi:hypothetical protein|uniref:hypothetical protein n=1 Tax=Gaiella sp. TaxID=2663207 RepID=UPI002E343DAA|nr:hypothetical protein [Gaiella sp.]HEX5584615.1 hypothetical protein [Gaiella sp.]